MRPLALLALGRLAVARARRRPARWLLAVAGIALATGFAGALFAQATITADASARAVLRSLPQLERAVRITWQGVVTPGVERRAGMLFDRLGLRNRADVVLMNPVRLGGIVVRPAAIRPLSAWVARFPRDATAVGRCVQESCPVLLAGGSLGRVPLLAAPGVRMPVLARVTLRSPVALGFVPSRAAGGAPPVLLSGDPRGLRTLAGLGATYRSDTWIAPVPVSAFHAWELGTVERRLQHVQSALLSTGSAFTMSAPFAGLDAARSDRPGADARPAAGSASS